MPRAARTRAAPRRAPRCRRSPPGSVRSGREEHRHAELAHQDRGPPRRSRTAAPPPPARDPRSRAQHLAVRQPGRGDHQRAAAFIKRVQAYDLKSHRTPAVMRPCGGNALSGRRVPRYANPPPPGRGGPPTIAQRAAQRPMDATVGRVPGAATLRMPALARRAPGVRLEQFVMGGAIVCADRARRAAAPVPARRQHTRRAGPESRPFRRGPVAAASTSRRCRTRSSSAPGPACSAWSSGSCWPGR